MRLFGEGPEKLNYGTVIVARSPGLYVIEDALGRRFDARSDMTLAPGARILYRGDWILSLAGRQVEAKVYVV